MKFARIIPVLRTPLGIEGFDYRLPDGQSIRKGDLVTASFRRRPVVGIVADLLADSAFAKRAISLQGSYAGLHFSEAFLELLQATAERTFCSPSTVLKSWLRDLPKRPHLLPSSPSTHPLHGLEAHWQQNPGAALLARAREEGQKRRVLIVTPWITRAVFLGSQLSEAGILHSDLSAGEAFKQWTRFLSSEKGVLVTTKIGAWLASMSDLVLLDEPEQDDHKQDESAPRYDARKLLLWCAQKGVTRVESFGLTPPLHATIPAPALLANVQVYIHHPAGRTAVPFLQADALQVLLEHTGPRIIIHPIRGTSARVACRDCHWQAMCERCGAGLSADTQGVICRACKQRTGFPATCPACGGVDLNKSLPGIERLQARWQKEYPDEHVEWRDTTAELLEAPLPPEAMVLLTDAALFGAGEDIRRRERQCLALRRLIDRVATVNGTLLIQCRESFAASISTWMTAEGMQEYMHQEREERRAFGYPPTTRLVKVIFRGSLEQAEAWQSKTDASLRKSSLKNVTWRGPLPIERQPKSRGERMIFHLLFPADTPEASLLQVLRPFATEEEVIIDLDPVAFLR